MVSITVWPVVGAVAGAVGDSNCRRLARRASPSPSRARRAGASRARARRRRARGRWRPRARRSGAVPWLDAYARSMIGRGVHAAHGRDARHVGGDVPARQRHPLSSPDRRARATKGAGTPAAVSAARSARRSLHLGRGDVELHRLAALRQRLARAHRGCRRAARGSRARCSAAARRSRPSCDPARAARAPPCTRMATAKSASPTCTSPTRLGPFIRRTGDDDDLAVGGHVHLEPLFGDRLQRGPAGRGVHLPLEAEPLGHERGAARLEVLQLARGRDADAPPQDDARRDRRGNRAAARTMRSRPRPRPLLGASPCAEPGAAGARVAGDLGGRRDDRAPGEHGPERRGRRRTCTSGCRGGQMQSSLHAAEGVLHEAILAGVVGDDRQDAAGREPVAQVREARARAPAARRSRRCAPPGTAARTRARPMRGPSAARIAPTRSSLVANGRVARRRTTSRASRPARGSSPYSRKIVISSPSSASLSSSAAERGASSPMRMSSGAPSRKEKPRDASSIWCEEMPRSSRMPVKRRSAIGRDVDRGVVAPVRR